MILIKTKLISYNKQILKYKYMNNKLNCCAYNITRPNKPRDFEFKGATAILDANRKGIAKLRQRGFTWTQVHQALEQVGIKVNYMNVYQWQLRRFRQR